MYPYFYFTKNIFICKALIYTFPFVIVLSASRLQNIVFPWDYIANAMLGFAWAVAEWLFMYVSVQNSGHLAKCVNYFGDFSFLLGDLIAKIGVRLRLHSRRHFLGGQGKFTT